MTADHTSENYKKQEQLVHTYIANFYKRDPIALIRHLREIGYTDTKIAKILNLSRQVTKRKYKEAWRSK